MPTDETNSDGEAVFTLSEGNYRATAELDGYQTASRSFSIGSGESITQTLTLQESEPGTITVVVTDANTGNPIQNATVTAGGSSASTNSLGEATLTLPAGEYEVIARANGYIQNENPTSLNWGESISMTIPLEAEAEPTLIDDFERDSISPWTNTHEEESDCIIRQESGLNSTNGMYIPAPGSAEVFAGLENFPEAGGGPNGDGSWEFYHRIESTGGTSNITRLDFAAQQGGDQWRWQVQTGYARIESPNGTLLDFSVGISAGNTYIFRINEWQNGTIDCSIHNANGSEIDSQSTTYSTSQTSGGMRVWSNYTTSFSIDSIHYLD